ncbi:MAG: AbrB/MazE/SpoVT family DNA-binding domain-containing protein [Butyrivibrio sp.]|nr:AbrB/MazE/SpoVT family DNA-binding domain-containing protein [Butyrivibrio sp.]
MELAKVTSKGQVTIPVAIRKLLGIREGDKILFVEDGEKVVMMNASTNALLKAQKAFEGVAEELGIKNEQDVVELVKEIRAERGEQYKCE